MSKNKKLYDVLDYQETLLEEGLTQAEINDLFPDAAYQGRPILLESAKRKITQTSWTGEVSLTKPQYIERWESHLLDTERIANSSEELKKIRAFNEEMQALVERNFETIYESQNTDSQEGGTDE